MSVRHALQLRLCCALHRDVSHACMLQHQSRMLRLRTGRNNLRQRASSILTPIMTSTDSQDVEHAISELKRLCDSINDYATSHPAVTGSERLLKRAQSDLSFVRKLSESSKHADTTASSSATVTSVANSGFKHLREEQLQGVLNNIRGMAAELAVAQQATAVISLGTRFFSQVAAGEATVQSTSHKAVKAAVLANHFIPSGESVEVDVVAQQGLAWIEVKAYEPFDVDSTQWLGNPGHFKGLEQQAQLQLRVAQSECQRLKWQQPTVVFHFPQGVHQDVKLALEDMGAVVSGPGAFSSSVLPPLPSEPAICNLDVTTLCALVSEVSNGDPLRPLLQQWAQRVTHWQECLAAEEQLPMLPMLDVVLSDKKLIASRSAIFQFEKLLSQFGGPFEQSRWLLLKSRLLLFCGVKQPYDALHQAPDAAELCDEASSTLQTCPYSNSRVASLQAVSATQKEVFALGDLQHAVTLTANGRATEFAARQGIKLEVFVHRAVWLTGM